MIQGFSGGLLNRELIYQTDLPSFQRDFASLKTLNHGTGPDISTTSFRGSSATYFDADGVLQTAGTNVPRFDHSATGSSLGLLIEESRTNSIRNAQAGGATNGVIGSGGVMPTNWTISGHNTNGVTTEIVGTGTDSGFAYIDLKISGTTTANNTIIIGFESNNQIVAANGQTWTQSCYAKLQAGSTSGANYRVVFGGRIANGSQVANTGAQTFFTPTTALLVSQRTSATGTFTDATVERVLPMLWITSGSGNTLDLTLRIAAPQLEQGAFPTSYIPTTNAAATRAADSAVVTPISSFYNQSEGTLFGEAIGVNNIDSAVTRRFAEISDADNSRLLIGYNTLAQSRFRVISGGSDQADVTVSRTMGGALARIAGAYSANDFQQATNGTLGTADSSGSLPQVSRLNIGTAFAVDKESVINGHIRKVAYWPKRLTNTLLQQLTT